MNPMKNVCMFWVSELNIMDFPKYVFSFHTQGAVCQVVITWFGNCVEMVSQHTSWIFVGIPVPNKCDSVW